MLAAGATRHSATWSERLVRCAEGIGIALSGGVDRGTAEGCDDSGDGHGRRGFPQPHRLGEG